MVIWKTFPLFLVLFHLPFLSFSSPPAYQLQWEEVINKEIHSYDLSEDNLFKLAAYTELKGRYSPSNKTLVLRFGDLGSITFYQNNCLFKAPNHQVFHLNKGEGGSSSSKSMDDALFQLFENIPLLGNHNSNQELVQFVNKHLAKKNIEPFDKLFIRHVLIRYGRFNKQRQEVIFHTDNIPSNTYYTEKDTKDGLVKRYKTPLSIRLDPHILRGYYLDAGGTVYVEDVDRPVAYATSEQYTHNVTAFKVFMQKLFVQSVQYVTQSETKRLKEYALTHAYTSAQPTAAPPSGYQQQASASPLTPYHKYNWIPMMLAMLRAQEVNIGEPHILKYFIHEPYFNKIYEQLTKEEKRLVDRY